MPRAPAHPPRVSAARPSTVPDGTNTKDEKAAFVAAVFKRMGELLGPLHSVSYVHANEVRGDAYGYGGLTQEQRYIAGKLGIKSAAAA